MKIRNAKVNELDFIIKGIKNVRFNEGYKDTEPMEKDIEDSKNAIERNNIRIIELDGKPMGYLYFKTDFKLMYVEESFLWVQRIYIENQNQGKGLGKLLYDDAKKIAKKKGFSKIFCDVYNANKNAINFHRKLGFKPRYTIHEKDI